MIVFLCGPRGSGKDAVAARFIERHPEYTRVAFADPIKQFVMELFHLTSIEQYDAFKRSQIQTTVGTVVEGREIVRGIGMRLLSYNESQFTDYVKSVISNNLNVLVTDTRMTHEFRLAMYYKRRFGNVCIAQVTRTGVEYDGHVTETPPAVDVDVVLDNNQSLDQTVEQLEKYILRDEK